MSKVGDGGGLPPQAASAPPARHPHLSVPVQGVPWVPASFLPTVTAVSFELLRAPGRQTEEHLAELRHCPHITPTTHVQEGEPVAS